MPFRSAPVVLRSLFGILRVRLSIRDPVSLVRHGVGIGVSGDRDVAKCLAARLPTTAVAVVRAQRGSRN